MTRVCAPGPKLSGLGFDFSPAITALTEAGSKYLDYKTQKAQQDAARAQANLELLQAQRQTIAAGAGGISGAMLALLGVGAFLLLRGRR